LCGVHISWLRQKKGGKPADDETLQGFRGNSARETSPLSSFPPGNVATRFVGCGGVAASLSGVVWSMMGASLEGSVVGCERVLDVSVVGW